MGDDRTAVHEDYRREIAAPRSSDQAFGLVFAVFFLVLGLWPLANQGSPRLWALAAGTFFGLAATLRPALLRRPNQFWTWLGLTLARIVNPLVTGVLFFLVFTPMALLMRLLGRVPLRLHFDPEATTYWVVRQPPGPPPEGMPHQF